MRPKRTTQGIIPLDPSEPITDEMRRQLRDAWPNYERLKAAWDLAKDFETCEALLLGLPVDPSRIDQDALRSAATRRLVRLDTTPLDLL